MNIHKNAALTLRRRRQLVQFLSIGASQSEAARRFQVSRHTVRKWWVRFQELGNEGLFDVSSRPHRSPRRIKPEEAERILALRTTGLLGEEIAELVKRSRSTVSKVLRGARLSKPGELQRDPSPVRYEHKCPGDLLHLDIKKLGKFNEPGHRVHGDRQKRNRNVGWEYVHVAIDDYSRVAYVEVLDQGETAAATSAFLQRAVEHFKHRGVGVRRVMTDNGSGYKSKQFNRMTERIGVGHIRTRPYTPKTNGKAERFIQTIQREWAYVRPYSTSMDRRRALPRWIKRYNEERPHSSLGKRPPITRMENQL